MILACLILVSTYNLVVLTMERYFKIIYPFHYIKSFCKWKLWLALFLPWAIGFGYTLAIRIPPFVSNDGCNFTQKKTVRITVTHAVMDFLVTFVIPIIIMTFCYIRIFVTLRKSSQKFTAPTSIKGKDSLSPLSLKVW